LSNVSEDIAQPGFGINAIKLTGLDQRVNYGSALAALVRAGEGPVAAANNSTGKGGTG